MLLRHARHCHSEGTEWQLFGGLTNPSTALQNPSANEKTGSLVDCDSIGNSVYSVTDYCKGGIKQVLCATSGRSLLAIVSQRVSHMEITD